MTYQRRGLRPTINPLMPTAHLPHKTGADRRAIYLGMERRDTTRGHQVIVSYTTDFANQGMRVPTGNREIARRQRQEAARAARS